MKPKKEQLFYFDAEWVPVVQDYFSLKMDFPLLADAFEHQVEKWRDKDDPYRLDPPGASQYWDERAHMNPEFCKIVCVSYGYFNKGNFFIKSLYGEDEKKLLKPIPALFEKVGSSGYYLCGYAIKRYDMPWLSKRLMANGFKPPSNLCVYGKKPWDVEVFDLPEVWGQGCNQESYTPFEVACAAVGLESSKGDLSGPQVKEAFWNGEIERIRAYCEKDVLKTKELAVILIDLLP